MVRGKVGKVLMVVLKLHLASKVSGQVISRELIQESGLYNKAYSGILVDPI